MPDSQKALSVDLFFADLNLKKAVLNKISGFLSKREILKSKNFRNPKDKKYFIARKGLLRVFLSNYLNKPPDKIKIDYGFCQKPFLRGRQEKIYFNYSHSGAVAVFAFSFKKDIGVDVEKIRKIERRGIVNGFFSKKEKETINKKPPKSRNLLFFKYWSIKEACLKAEGLGIKNIKDVNVLQQKGVKISPFILKGKQKINFQCYNTVFIKNNSKYALAVAVRKRGVDKIIIRKKKSANLAFY